MNCDIYAEFKGSSGKDVDALLGDKTFDIATQIHLLAGIAAQGAKDYAISGDCKKGGGYKSLVHPGGSGKNPYGQRLIQEELMRLDALGLLKPPEPPMEKLPVGSFFLQFQFTLAKPYLSKDDDPFYVAEGVNPVRKDKVFRVPMATASSWKGLLRWTVRGPLSTEKDAVIRLFGNEKEEEPFVSGRLVNYPTFFDNIDLEVINPHSRKTKAGTLPIYLECVPIGAKGFFSLLYVPFDLIGQDGAKIRAEASKDLKTVAEGLSALMLRYGFSAKRSSGFGVAEDRLIGGFVQTREDRKTLTLLSKLAQEVEHVRF